MEALNKYSSFLWENRATSLAQITLATPIFSIYEKQMLEMDNLESSIARLTGASIIVLGAGPLYEKFRQFSHFMVAGAEEMSETKIKNTDRVSNALFNLPRGAIIYTVAGIESGKEFALGVLGTVGYGLTVGASSGYLIDLSKEALGTKKIERESIRKNSKSKNKLILGTVLASSILITGINDSVDFEEIINLGISEEERK